MSLSLRMLTFQLTWSYTSATFPHSQIRKYPCFLFLPSSVLSPTLFSPCAPSVQSWKPAQMSYCNRALPLGYHPIFSFISLFNKILKINYSHNIYFLILTCSSSVEWLLLPFQWKVFCFFFAEVISTFLIARSNTGSLFAWKINEIC